MLQAVLQLLSDFDRRIAAVSEELEEECEKYKGRVTVLDIGSMTVCDDDEHGFTVVEEE